MSDNGLKRFKYLDDLGIKQEKYFTNFCDTSDERYPRCLELQKEYGFDDRETWNLDCIPSGYVVVNKIKESNMDVELLYEEIVEFLRENQVHVLLELVAKAVKEVHGW